MNISTDLSDVSLSKNCRAALTYAHMGIPVFPCRPKGKEPITANGVKNATLDRAQIIRWWSEWPDANIGLATGDGLLVLDFDSQEAIEKLKAEFNSDLNTPTAITSRGVQCFFASTENVKNHVGFREHVDVRSAGGYVIAAPSTHPSGPIYKWDPVLHPRKMKFSPIPQNILEALKSHRSANITPLKTRGEGSSAPQINSPNIVEGGRNDFLCRMVGSFLRQYDVDHAHTMLHSLNEKHCQPPLSSFEVEKIFHSVARLEVERRGGVR